MTDERTFNGNGITITTVADGLRRCGDCTLCCRLLPMLARPFDQACETAAAMIVHGMAKLEDFAGMVPDFAKPAGERCRHQRTGKGCAIYATRPSNCRLWSCRWLTNADTADLRRPDRSRYVIDPTPDFVTSVNNETGERHDIAVIQIWVDPKTPDAWRDPALLAYLDRQGQKGSAAIIRYNDKDAFTLFPPAMSSDRQWHEIRSGIKDTTHSVSETVAALANARKVVLE